MDKNNHINWRKIETALMSDSLKSDLHEDELAIFNELKKFRSDEALLHILQDVNAKDKFQKIKDILQLKEKGGRIIPLMYKWKSIAAAIIIIAFAGVLSTLIYKHKQNPVLSKNKSVYKNDILPGGNKATLTLADGSTIVLDSTGNGVIANNGAVKVVKQNNNQLKYISSNAGAERITYNTLTTPRGGQFKLVLPDGTKVWLNAASSIHYPTQFTGKERKVEITGELYFEVAHNAAMPFKVDINHQQEIEVLGTHFNINAYDHEASINTTLLEGSVKIINQKGNKILKPGQQSQLTKAGNIDIIDDVDIDKIMAWKNGLFDFNNTKLESVMNQLAKWYDIEIVYDDNVPNIEFGGKMQMNLKLSEVLQILEKVGIHFKIEGKALHVMN